MFNILIKALFWIIGLVADIFIYPIKLILESFGFELGNMIMYTSLWLNQGLDNIIFFIKLLGIPPAALNIYFGLLSTMLLFWARCCNGASCIIYIQ